jgi:hypothetical protein
MTAAPRPERGQAPLERLGPSERFMAGPLVLNEKRNLPRRELIFYLKATDLLTNQELGRMIDIHAQGLLLMSLKPLELGREYMMGVELPKALQAQSATHVDFKAKCVWLKRSRVIPYTEHGLMITEKSVDSERTIAMLIELFALPDSGARI